MLHIDQPFANHNGGQLQFGPDRFLYVGMGDGGSGNDPQCNAQRNGTLLGKMLRIDIDQYRRRGPFYGIPRDNPFADGALQPPEVWALGLRNPWRFSFDRATGDLFIADVGQGSREEIDFQAATSGGGLYNASSSSPVLVNAILWGNTAGSSGAQLHNDGSTPTISYSAVEGGCPAGTTCSGLVAGDPYVLALADNGGPVRTIALRTGSSALT